MTSDLVVVDCAECGLPFGILESYRNRRLNDGKAFWCPSGHVNVYTPSKIEKLEKQLKTEQSHSSFLADRLSAAERKLKRKK